MIKGLIILSVAITCMFILSYVRDKLFYTNKVKPHDDGCDCTRCEVNKLRNEDSIS